MGAMALALGVAVLFNFIILRIKWARKEYANVGVDVLMLLALNLVFGGSILGVISATVGSTLISLYLIWYPIKLFSSKSISLGLQDTFSRDSNKRQEAFTRMADKIDELFET